MRMIEKVLLCIHVNVALDGSDERCETPLFQPLVRDINLPHPDNSLLIFSHSLHIRESIRN